MNTIRAGITGAFSMRRAVFDQRISSSFRYLYNAQFLSLDKYVDAREVTLKQYGNMKDNFMARMKQQVDSSSPSIVFTDDLKSVVHLVGGTADELDLCKKMIKKFHHQNKELRFGTFIFGPVIMRMLYHLQQIDLALELIKDPEIDGFFDQLKSYFLLMDLLLKNKRYQDVLDLNDILMKKQLLDTKYPRDCFVLACAACYKLNTLASYNYSINLVAGARAVGAEIIQRALHFVVLLALNQNHPDVSLELISSFQNKNNVHANNLKLMTLARLNRVHEAFLILRRKVEEDSPVQSSVRGEILECSLTTLKEAIEQLNDTEFTHEFDQLSRSLREGNFVLNQTIEEMVMTPVAVRAGFRMRPGFGDEPQRPYTYGVTGRPEFPRTFRREPLRREAFGGDQRQPRMRQQQQQQQFYGNAEEESQRREPVRRQSFGTILQD